jgi:hypothetical protein
MLADVVVIELDAADAADVPFAFDAVTVNVYEVEPVKPETVIGLDDPVPVIPPGLDVAVYVVATAPKVAGVNATVAVLEPVAVAVPIVGVCGIAAEVLPLPNLKELLVRLVSVLSLFTDTMKSRFQKH